MKVIGTAGHIDHGKSALVRRLTGIDPDRLEEEQRRGMTIDLGFAWLALPSGEDVSMVDVPGHERFVKNMLAGAGGVDVALLVVASDEAVMPQTREHLDILDLLGIEHGVVALTKRDLVDEEWLGMAAEDVGRLLRGTTLEGSEIVPVSALTGQGVPELLDALARAVDAAPVRVDLALPFVPVDRVFTVGGFGTVVTGTLQDGSIHAGQEVEILPAGTKARVRSLQTHRRAVDRASPGARVAINLAGVDRGAVNRGDVIVRPGTVNLVSRFDAAVRVVAAAPFGLAHGMEITLHMGAADYSGRVSLLGTDCIEPGDENWVQIRLESPVPVIRGQRFIIRLPAPARTLAGGSVIDVAPRHRRFDAVTAGRLEDLRSVDPHRQIVARLGSPGHLEPPSLARSLRLSLESVERALKRLEREGAVVAVGGEYMTAATWNSLAAEVGASLERYHREFPLRRGMPKEELRSRSRWPHVSWGSVLDKLVADGRIRQEEAVVALPTHRGGIEARRAEADRVLSALAREPYCPPVGQELLRLAGTDVDFLAAMHDAGQLVRVSEGIYFTAAAYERLVAETLSLIHRDGQVSVSEVRDSVGTTRRYALALLEHLDARKITRRVGDVRVRGTKAPACA